MRIRYIGNILLWAGIAEMALGIYGWVLFITVVTGAVVTAWGAWREAHNRSPKAPPSQ